MEGTSYRRFNHTPFPGQQCQQGVSFKPAHHPSCGPVNPGGAAVEVLSHGFFGPGGGGGEGVSGQLLLDPDPTYSIHGVNGRPSALVTVTTGQFAK